MASRSGRLVFLVYNLTTAVPMGSIKLVGRPRHPVRSGEAAVYGLKGNVLFPITGVRIRNEPF